MDPSSRRQRRISDQDGFGLTELVIAIAILTVGILVVFTVIETAIGATTRAGVKTTASVIASAEMERVRAMPWTSIGLDEADIAGTDSAYQADTAWAANAADRVDIAACPASPCTNMVPTRNRVGADSRTYRVDIYATWRAVPGGEDVKLVTVVVRSPAAPGSSLAELNSSFEDDRRGSGGGPPPPPPGNRAPEIAHPGNRHDDTPGQVFLTLDGSDLDGDPLTYSATNLPPGLSLNPATGDITGTPSNPSGGQQTETHTVVATVSDGQLTGSVTFLWTIYKGNYGAVNLATGGTATQSSTATANGDTYVASRAIDDDTDGVLANGSVSSTWATYRPWWDLDLGSLEAIDHIRIHNRTDCCSTRLRNFYVMVSETPFTGSLAENRDQSVFWEHLSGNVGTVANVDVNDEARYVRIRLADLNFLTLAEVQVIATSSGT